MPNRLDDAAETRPAEDAITFDTAITAEDWVDFALYNARPYYGPRRLRGLIIALVTLVGAFAAGDLFGWLTGGGLPSLRAALLLDAPASASAPVFICFGLFGALAIGRFAFYDRLLRRRHRRWALREHGPGPAPFRCRFDASGYSADDAHGHAHKSWSALKGLEETDRQFFLIGRTGHAAPIPKRDLSPTDQQRLRAFVQAHLLDRARASEAVDPVLAADADGGASVVVRYEQTARDRAAATLLVWQAPARRRRRAWIAVAVALGLALAMVIIDTLSWWLGWRARPGGERFTPALVAFMRGEAAGFSPQALYAAAVGLGFWAAWPWLLRRQATAMARPRGVVPVHLAFSAAGMVTAVPDSEFRYGWAEVRAVLEGPEHLALLLPLSVVLPIPKRALDAAGLLALRNLLTEHVGRD